MRCFVAIELREPVRESLERIQSRLRRSLGELSWVRPGNIHLTLKFLGDIDAGQVAAIGSALDSVAHGVPPFEFEVGGLGVFPPHGQVNVVWVGVREPSGRLKTCQRECESALGAIGFSVEERPFHPHLTLARNKNPRLSEKIRGAIAKCEAVAPCRQRAEGMTFFQSKLEKAGARYEVIGHYAFSER